MVNLFGVLGLIGTIDTAYHQGTELVALCKAFANAETHLHESVVRVEACWLKIQLQLELIRRLEPQLSEWHKNIQQQALEILLQKLHAANTKLSGLVKKSDVLPTTIVEVNRLKYAFMKDRLADTITDLEVWQGVFDPSWFLMMKIVGPEADQQLYSMSQQQQPIPTHEAKPVIPVTQQLRRALKPVEDDGSRRTVFLPPGGLDAGSIQSVAYSPVRMARRADNGELVVLNPITCVSRANINSALRDIRNFARRLKHTDPFTFGLLECKGILNEEGSDTRAGTDVPPTGLSFIFRMPPSNSHVQSLRRRLLSGPSGEHDSLSARFDLARQLVNAVSYVHLGNYGSAGGDEMAILVGFDILRDAEGKTNRLGDDDWEKNLYRHPQRQGKTLRTDYNMRHDMYSIGVCLLEAGLWSSFVEYDKVDEKIQSSPGSTNFRPSLLGSKLAIEAGITSGPEFLKSPERVKDRLLQLARGALRRSMGDKYSKVVETCLTCLDEGNEDFGDDGEFQDEDGFAVGAMYIEKVVQKLGEISV
ncbi:hypothetical protein ACQKWADRAFT_331611 [Trichoderma austrokoningii]